MIPLISTGRSEPWKVGIIGSNRSEEHTSELQSRKDLVCRLLLEKRRRADARAIAAATPRPNCARSTSAFRFLSLSHASTNHSTSQPSLARHSAAHLFFLKKRGPPKTSPLPLPAPLRF